jgi:predicted dehydrogenase
MAKPKKTLRIGVIGTGAFAEQCHLPGLQSHPQARVVAICGRGPARLRFLADRFKIPAVFTNYLELCARTDIDAVTIVTSDSQHAEQAKAAFASGKHVFCEKPMATNVMHARQMVRAAEMSGKIHQMAFTYRYLYGLRELRRRVRRGDIGVPYHLRAQHNTWDDRLPDTSLRSGRVTRWSGVLYNMGPHLFDLARFLFGPIESVMGFSQHIPRSRMSDRNNAAGIEADDLATAWFIHESGIRGQWFTSRAMPWFGEKSHVEVIGDEGALRASLSRGSVDVLRVSRPGNTQWEELPLPREAHTKSPSCLYLMMRSFVDACLRGTLNADVDASFHDGFAAQLAIASVEQANARLPWITLENSTRGKSDGFKHLSPNDEMFERGLA